MEFFNVVKKRRSTRAYVNKPIEEDNIKWILEAANSAPSAGNQQSYEIFLVKDEGKKRALVEASFGQDFVAEASVVLVFCANPERSGKYGSRGRDLYSIQDATIAAAYSQLAATALGLASVWVGSFDEGEVLKVLENPKGLMPIAIIPIGYSAEEPEATPRRKLDDIVHDAGI